MPGERGPQEGADDSARGQRGLEHVRLEPLLQEVGRAHGHQLHEHMELFRLEAQEVLREAKQAGDVTRAQPGGIGWHDTEQVLDRAGHMEERPAVVVVRLRVAHGEAGDLPPAAVVIGVPVEAVAVRQRGERALQRQDGEPVAGELQFADDLRAHQAHHVREDAVAKAREDLLGDGGASQQRPRFQHAHVEARARQVGRVHQAVVPAAHHDHVVFPGHCRSKAAGIPAAGWT